MPPVALILRLVEATNGVPVRAGEMAVVFTVTSPELMTLVAALELKVEAPCSVNAPPLVEILGDEMVVSVICNVPAPVPIDTEPNPVIWLAFPDVPICIPTDVIDSTPYDPPKVSATMVSLPANVILLPLLMVRLPP